MTRSKGEETIHPSWPSKSTTHQSRRTIMRVPAFLLLVATAILTENGKSSTHNGSMFCSVAAFQSPSPYNNQGRPQNYPARSRIVEPEHRTTTDFPRTNPPADRRDKKSSMFQPMEQNERTTQTRQRQHSRQKVVKSIWETSAPVLVEASSLHTFDFEQPTVERVQVLLKKADMDPVSGKRRAAGEPLIARLDLWHGPDSTPQNLAIYLEEEEDEDYYYEDVATGGGTDTPFSTIIETPQGHNTIAIRNIADSSDLLACVQEEEVEHHYDAYTGTRRPSKKNDSPLQSVVQRLKATTTPQRIDSTTARREDVPSSSTDNEEDDEENEAVVGSCAVELPSNIASVQVLLQTEFMQPLQARIELELRMMEDPSSSNYKVVKRTIVEVFSEDGMHRPFFAVLEAPRKKMGRRRSQGGANEELGWFGDNKNAYYSTSMRVVNLSTTEFPLYATVEPHAVDPFPAENQQDRPSSSSSSGEEDDEEDHQWTHFGGGSSYDMSSNSTILDAEIL